MSKKTVIWLITATLLIIIGGVIFVCAMSVNNWNFLKLGNNKYKTNTCVSENFSSISIESNTEDIVFAVSQNGECEVICYEEDNIKFSVAVLEDTLTIRKIDNRKWYQYIGVNTANSKITVNLPESEYKNLSIKESTGKINIPKDFKFENIDISASTGDIENLASGGTIKIKTSTGSIHTENISANSLELSVSTGKVTVKSVDCKEDIKINVSTGKTDIADIKCKNLFSKGSTGSIKLNNVIAEDKFSIERSTGDVKLDKCDAKEVFIKTDTGDVKGSFLSEKVFITETDTGRVEVPKNISGGRCEIETDTGDIKFN